MPPRYNPFRPGSVVPSGLFSGRLNEIEKLEQGFYQTKNGNPHHFVLQGERGIGKSSLMFYLSGLASGNVKPFDLSFRFLTINVDLERSDTDLDIIRKIATELKSAISALSGLTQLGEKIWDFVSHLEVKGIRYHADKAGEPRDALTQLTDVLATTSSDLGDSFDGILILIDEADKPAPAAKLGAITKLLTERLTRRGCHRLAIGLAGLPSLIRTLRESHESSPRIFTIFNLEPLLPDERRLTIKLGLEAAERTNGYKVTITPEAEEWISVASEGYPHFIQQFAYCAFERDTDNVIDVTDASEGAFNESGAFDQLGIKYFEEQYFDQIRSDEYRKVLQAMSERYDAWVKKEALRKQTGLKESTLNNAINALTKRRIIIPRKGVTGEYRLPTKAFAVWIRGVTVPAAPASS